jgi:tetratricopeptide (TPR) repeat protein
MQKSAAVCAFFIVLLFVFQIDAHAVSARDLNTEGYRLYLKEKFPEALDYFRRAVAADPDYALARYNLACTLGVLRKQGPEAVCRYDAYKSAILDQLEEAVRLDPKTREKMQTDTDLDTVRDTVRYLRLLGYSSANQDDVGAILVAVSWFGPAPGAFGPAAAVDFRADGTLTLTLLDTTGEEVKHTEFEGTYIVSASRITIILDRPIDGVSRFEGGMLPGGSLDVPGLPGPFSDDPHECEA